MIKEKMNRFTSERFDLYEDIIGDTKKHLDCLIILVQNQENIIKREESRFDQTKQQYEEKIQELEQ